MTENLFDADALKQVELQVEAREAWTNDRRLVVGAYYRHRNGWLVRRVIEIEDRYVRWTDRFNGLSPWRCLLSSFRTRVTGAL